MNTSSAKVDTYSIFAGEICIKFSGSYISAILRYNIEISCASANEICDACQLTLAFMVDICPCQVYPALLPFFSLLRLHFKQIITIIVMTMINKL